MKKILFIAGTLGQGGAERQLYYLLNLLNKEYRIKLLSFTQGEFYEDKLKKIGIDVEYIKQRKNKILKIRDVIKKAREFSPDYIYSFHFYTNFYGAIAGRFTNSISIGSIRNDAYVEKKNNGIFSWLHYSLPDKIVANSHHGATNAKKIFFKRNIIVLPNIIDFEKFNCNSKENNKTLCFVGRMFPVKRPELFINLIKNLNKYNYKGIMIGQGPLLNKTKKEAENQPIQFIASTNNIPAILSKCSALIITSTNEGTPNVALEAIACRRPVLSLRFSGVDFFEKENLIFTFNSIDEMKKFIVNELPNISKQILEKRRNKLKKYFSKEAASKIIKEQILI